jgi:hypothetical protein
MNEFAVARRMFMKFTGNVYFVQCENDGPIKIGYTADVKSRLRQLQTSNHEKLILLCWYPSDAQHEKEWHSAFHKIKIRGEWFHPYPKLLREIKLQIELNEKQKIRGEFGVEVTLE